MPRIVARSLLLTRHNFCIRRGAMPRLNVDLRPSESEHQPKYHKMIVHNCTGTKNNECCGLSTISSPVSLSTTVRPFSKRSNRWRDPIAPAKIELSWIV